MVDKSSKFFSRSLTSYFAVFALTIVAGGLCENTYAANSHEVWGDANSLAELQQFYINNKTAAAKIGTPKLYLPAPASSATSSKSLDQLTLIAASKDGRGVYHDRYDQYFRGLPVWGSQLIFHISNKKSASLVNGRLTTEIEKDIDAIKPTLAEGEVLKIAANKYSHFSLPQTKLIIYVDSRAPAAKAKLAYTVTFFVQGKNSIEKPFYIIDANSGEIYQQWNDLRTVAGDLPGEDSANTASGQSKTSAVTQIPQANSQLKGSKIGIGFGGNTKWHEEYPNGPYKFQYGKSIPGLMSLSNFEVTAVGRRCFMKSADFEVASLYSFDPKFLESPVLYAPINQESNYPTRNFTCPLGLDKEDNGGLALDNDVMFGVTTTINMYRDVYGFDKPFWKVGETPITIRAYSHVRDYDNAFAINGGEEIEKGELHKWHSQIWIGSGYKTFYPLSDLETIAHELSHVFTDAHSELIYESQSGGINEAFSDMAGAAAIDYVKKQYTWYPFDWTIGKMTTKVTGYFQGKPLRYFYNPPLDGRSIGNAHDYYEGLDVHLSSGVFNKAFYLLSISPGWSIEKAFTVFANANAIYWIPSSTFNEASCGVIQSAQDLGMPTADVVSAFAGVGVVCRAAPKAGA